MILGNLYNAGIDLLQSMFVSGSESVAKDQDKDVVEVVCQVQKDIP